MIETIDELETVFDSFSSVLPKELRERRPDRMRMLLNHLGNPEKSFRTYHIAGSKGKGSTGAYLAALIGNGCALYTSPHLFTIRERFTQNGCFFPDDIQIRVCNKLLEAVSSFSFPQSLGPEKPTEFEMYTAFAYMLFKEAGCSDAVIETGIGGRLDATNTIESSAVILTPVELEHTETLGDTIEKIAKEKAGIINSASPVFSSAQTEDAERVFRARAKELSAPFYYLPDYLSSFRSEPGKLDMALSGRRISLNLRMATEAMGENAALAILTADKLSLLTDGGLKAMEKVQLPGRFERRIVEGHLVVIDTAHTPRSAEYTRRAFLSVSKSVRKTLIFALAEGKKEKEIIRMLFPDFDRIIITGLESSKKTNPERILEEGRSMFPEKDIMLIAHPDEALDSALALSSDILITGSFYLAGEMKKLRKYDEP